MFAMMFRRRCRPVDAGRSARVLQERDIVADIDLLLAHLEAVGEHFVPADAPTAELGTIFDCVRRSDEQAS
jgi:hypothetical protein